MRNATPRICVGCRRRVIGKCDVCTPASAPRPAAKRVGYGRREADRRKDTVRAWVARNGWVCPGWQREQHPAEDLTADHLDPLNLGGPQGGPLGILCRSCNSAKQDSLEPPRVPGLSVTLIAGPPCGGKSTYLRTHAGPNDLVVDYDAIAVALQASGTTHQQIDVHKHFIWEARDAVLERLALGNHGVRAAWVIASAPKRKERDRYRRRYGAQVVVVTAPEEVCLRRAMSERPDDWYGHVRGWFDKYEPDPLDVVVRGYEPGV